MFEFLFRYPPTAFSRGQIALAGAWPAAALVVLSAAVSAGLAWVAWRRRNEVAGGVNGWRLWAIWGMQSALAVLLLVILWQPVLLVPTLKPQQNVIAVVVDDSRSMSIADEGAPRIEQAKQSLEAGTLDALKKRFQARVFRLGGGLERISTLEPLKGQAPATRIGDGLLQLSEQTAGLPVGAVVLLSDGSDNAGGIDLATMAALRAWRVPVHAVGFGREQPEKDVEVGEVLVSSRALADSRLSAAVNITQQGLAGTKAMLKVKDGSKTLASKPVTLAADGAVQVETLVFSAGKAGARGFSFSVDPVGGETNTANNSVSRMVQVTGARPRILYIEGEPRWEFKFIRRAVEDDKALELVTMLRTTQNKIYRQGIGSPKELEQGFPTTVDELFNFQAIIIGSVEFNYFSAGQQELLKQFVDRRGGGLIFLNARSALSEGGWARGSLAELLPVFLPDRKGTFHREPANVELSLAGMDSVVTRLSEDPAANGALWKKLPYLADYQEIGTPKPGAAVLADLIQGSKARHPFLVTHSYGRGRVAVVAGSTWRWQMSAPLEDQSHEMFWRQMLRWASADTPGRVLATTPRQVLADVEKLPLTVEVRDKNYLPASDAKVEVKVMGPAGEGGVVELQPDPSTPGTYSGEWTAKQPGQYVAEVTASRGQEEAGRDTLTFDRQDGVAESFRTGQNRELLTRLAEQTGGRYWTPSQMKRLPEEVSYSESGVTVRETRELWNMPIVFVMIAGLRSAEWLLRRKWGVV
jgi:uncharacterized membrane protein